MILALLDANVDYLITAKLKDFQTPTLQIEKIKVIHPDSFVCQLFSQNPDAVFISFEKLVLRLKNPPQSKTDVLNTLEKCGLVKSVRILGAYKKR
jgi:hypothetical protein